MSSSSILSPALDLFEQQLRLFVESPDFYANIALAFGESHDYSAFEPISEEESRTGVLDLIEVIPLATLNGAYGAFSRDTNKIYLASEYVTSASVASLSKLLLEEYGHYIDARLNPVETIGDEGEIFANLVQGNPVNPAAFTEDDTAIITLNETLITIEQGSPIIYVRQGATGANNGTSWANAYTDLRTAINAAPTSSEIWVAAGTYTPTTTTDRTISFQLKNGIEFYGGFAGNERIREQRNWQVNPTILSGDIGTPGQKNDNTYNVVNASNVTSTTRLDGFVIRDGNASDDGGGIYNSNGNAIFANLIVVDNNASDDGGGMYNYDSFSRLINVVFKGNTASSYGGGVYNYDSHLVLESVQFINNTAYYGGGIYNFSSNPSLTNVSFISNEARYEGGGIYNFSSNPRLINGIFDRNLSKSGGGIYNSYSSPILTHITFSNNQATTGGAIESHSSTSIVNITNSIFWGNQAITDPLTHQINNRSGATTSITSSIVEGGYGLPGNNNLNANPLFVNAAAGNLHLQGNSPAINRGTNGAVTNVFTDFDGNPRIVAGTVDLGAYEFVIDPAQYGASYGDLIQALKYNLQTLNDHYFSRGRFEGRQPDLFDEFRYIASNWDLITAYGLNGAAATEHYIRAGFFEGRSRTTFDAARYLNSYPDLFNALGTNTQAATFHYIAGGFKERRNPNLFPSDRYIASYPDLVQACRYNLEAGSNHYLYRGRGEGRQVLFNPQAYLNRYADLQAAFGTNLDAATHHYIISGFNEGRTWM